MNENEEIKKLKQEQNEQIKELKEKQKIKKEILKKVGLGFNVEHIHFGIWKKPAITIKVETLKDIKRIMNRLKPIKIFWIDNCLTDNLSKYEKQKYTTKENETITGTEYYKQIGKFFNIDFVLTTTPNKYDRKAEITYYSDKYRIDIEFNQDLIKEHLKAEQHKDEYETEQARKYNYKHADIMRTDFMLIDSDNEDIKRIDFYGGNKTHFAITKKGKEKLKSILRLKWADTYKCILRKAIK